MSPYAHYVFTQLCERARHTGGPVRTVVLADLLGIAPRTARNYMRRLETNGYVTRLSPRSGWLPARMAGIHCRLPYPAPAMPQPSAYALAAGRGRAAALTTRQARLS